MPLTTTATEVAGPSMPVLPPVSSTALPTDRLSCWAAELSIKISQAVGHRPSSRPYQRKLGSVGTTCTFALPFDFGERNSR